MTLFECLPKNGRVCFLGDSITAAGLWIRHVTDYFLANHYELGMRPFNAGVPGDCASNALRRLYPDALGFFPDVTVVLFGMNDIGRDLYGTASGGEGEREERLACYERSTRAIVRELRAAGSAVFLCTPTPYDEQSEGETPVLYGCDGALGRCREIVLQTARRENAGVIDFYRLFHEESERAGWYT